MTRRHQAFLAGMNKPATKCTVTIGPCPCEAPRRQLPKIVDIKAAKDTGCGKALWRVGFRLKKPTCKGGWIVQEVRWSLRTRVKGGKWKTQAKSHYWEAWFVKRGDNLPDIESSYGYADQFSTGSAYPGKQGAAHVRGRLRFYEDMQLPFTFFPNNPNTFAGVLHATTITPDFWRRKGSRRHELHDLWNCIKKNKPGKLRTVPT